MELLVGLLSIAFGFLLLEVTHAKNGALRRWQVYTSVALGTACAALGILIVVVSLLDWMQGN